MIETIHIRNFQSHKDSTLELCNGVNVIIGESDVGKSAIIRALSWLVFNKPAGNAFMRHNVVKPTSVSVTAEFGELAHIRNEKQSWYELNGQTYKGFGTGVPPQVFQSMNMGDINFMRQLDPPFMFSKSGGELAQYLNKLINLDIIDNSLSTIKREVGLSKNQVSACEENITRLIASLDEFEDLPDMEQAVEAIEAKEKKIGKLKQRQKTLANELAAYKEAVETFNSHKWAGSAGKALADINDRIKALQDKKAKMKQLESALSALKTEEMNIQSCKVSKSLERAILRCSEVNDSLCAMRTQRDALKKLLEQFSAEDEKYKKFEKLEKSARADYEKIQPETCPLCGQKWR